MSLNCTSLFLSMVDVESEREAATAMMQLYLSPFTPAIIPSQEVSSSIPELNLNNLSKSDFDISHPPKTKTNLETLIHELESNIPPSPSKKTSVSSGRFSVDRVRPSRVKENSENLLPRLRSHARNRRRRNSISEVVTKKRGSSIDSEMVQSAPEESSYQKLVVGEDGERRIGIYTVEERKELIRQFLKKRKMRVWGKKIKYRVRKTFADSRLRVKGRFISKENESLLREALLLSM